MIEVELQIAASANSDAVIEIVEKICTANGLVCARKGTLASYAGCVHWHYKKDRDRGTLEITWWESGHRLWFKVAEGRAGAWIDETLPKLKKEIEVSLIRNLK